MPSLNMVLSPAISNFKADKFLPSFSNSLKLNEKDMSQQTMMFPQLKQSRNNLANSKDSQMQISHFNKKNYNDFIEKNKMTQRSPKQIKQYITQNYEEMEKKQKEEQQAHLKNQMSVF